MTAVLPYCVYSHNGVCKENWVVLDVCPTEVKEPWEEKIESHLKNIILN